MSPRTAPRAPTVHDVLGDDVDEVLRGGFYAPEEPGAPDARRPGTVPARPRPEHYKVICISLYNEDLARLDALVQALKSRGFTKASRSAVLRAAVEQFDPDRIQKGL
ncbi:MAG: hypothetical protein HY909_03515 [Deltaproteobacteria bacterium]|nr:hypothetical protein [Deltaproteobacteria bacterium]